MNTSNDNIGRREFLVASSVIAAELALRPHGLNAAPAEDPQPVIRTARELWAEYDPRAEPLDIEITKSWDEAGLHIEQLYFTGETWQGHTVRVFAYRAAPLKPKTCDTDSPTSQSSLQSPQRENDPPILNPSSDAHKPAVPAAVPAAVPGGILHLHGGGQTASLEWVRYWAGKGYVCVSHDFCGKAAGRVPQLVTDWGPTPASMMDPDAPRSSLRPTVRFNQWYHWILVARRALTLLEQHPQVDAKRLGVFGISVGGTLTWMVAGCDPRVAAAVPIYGVGQNTYTFPWQSPDDPVDEDTRLTRALFEPEGYAADVTCPLLFMNASNDHHGRLDLGMRTLALATKSSMLREIYTPKYVHHIEPTEAIDLPLWMDFHLRGIGPAWPASPKIAIHGAAGKHEPTPAGKEAAPNISDPKSATRNNSHPKITVTVDNPAEVERVTIYYGFNNPWPASRFYRTVTPGEVNGPEFTGDAPITSIDDTIYAFGNVAYRSGIQLSTRLVTTKAKDLPQVRPTLEKTLLIDTMENDQDWFWWLAPTDPVNQQPLLKPWQGPHGEQGFTHAPPGSFSFATTILSDPQFQREGNEPLLIDLWSATPPTTLEISVAQNFFQPGHTFYKYQPKLSQESGPWSTLKFQPTDFADEQGTALISWVNVRTLAFSDTIQRCHRAVFKGLRWSDSMNH